MQDLFNFVKEQVDARELVREYLGEPAEKGDKTWKWNSPFREGDRDPSLCAEKVKIKDFGGIFKGDIFNFVVAMGKAINCFEAMKVIAKKFGIELPGEFNTKYTKNVQNTKTKPEEYFVLHPTERKTDEIYCMFDNIAFSRKPVGQEIGIIKNSIPSLEPMSYPLQDIKAKLITGHTCIPAGIKSQNDWQDGINFYQVFMVDVDNVKTIDGVKKNITVDSEKHITVKKIIEYCKEINLLPTFVYYTFSNTEQQHKFRLVYILYKATQDKNVVKGIYNFFKENFKDYNIDTAPTNIATMFFGGTSIAYESDTFYEILAMKKEKAIDLPESKVIDNYDLQQSIKVLQGSQYVIGYGKLWFIKKSDNFVPISNFITYPIEKLTYKNGQDIEVTYKMKCLLLDEPNKKLPEQTITVEQLQKSNYIIGSVWDKYAIVNAGATNADKLREVTQIIGRHTMKEKTVYANTGFEKINGKLVYLYNGGAIGENAENILVDLTKDGLQRYCFTDKKFEIKQALQRSLSILNVADYSITIPLLATAYLSPLYSIFSKENINADYVLFVQGKSGTRKSSITAMILSHFGKFTRDNFPSSFRDTLNSIEKKAFVLKDSLNVIDDFNPEVIGIKKLDTVEKIFGMYGDRVGRTRMSQDGSTLKSPYIARGLCIVTGETVPNVAQSRIARSLIINIREDSIDLSKLAEIQDNTEELAFAMQQFIKWIIKNETKIVEFAKKQFNETKIKQTQGVHGRTLEISNILTLGFKIFTQFLTDYQVLDVNSKISLDNNCESTLLKLVEQQSEEIVELKPTEMFYNAIEQLFTSNKIKVLEYPTKREVYGYCGENVGYFDDKENLYYFLPDVIYSKVNDFYNDSGIKFPVNSKALWKYLHEEGKLRRTDERRYKTQKMIQGNKVTVVEIRPAEGGYIPKRSYISGPRIRDIQVF